MFLRTDKDPDIFISMDHSPPSPTLEPALSPQQADTLDDVWGSSPSSPSLQPSGHESQSHQHPSDMPRLQQEHVTAGYRDGITAAKASSAQAGFDEGFGLGAVIGARAGLVLGVLEGLAAAVSSDEELGKLVEEARRELSVVSVFGREFWDEDGTWNYEVGRGDEEDTVFVDVAKAHPLVRKWEGVLAEQARRWRVDLEVLSSEVGVVRAGDEMLGEKKEAKSAKKGKEVLDW